MQLNRQKHCCVVYHFHFGVHARQVTTQGLPCRKSWSMYECAEGKASLQVKRTGQGADLDLGLEMKTSTLVL